MQLESLQANIEPKPGVWIVTHQCGPSSTGGVVKSNTMQLESLQANIEPKPGVWIVTHQCGPSSTGGVETARIAWSKVLTEQGRLVTWWSPVSANKKQDHLYPIPEGINTRFLDDISLPRDRFLPSLPATTLFCIQFLREKPERVIFNGHSSFYIPLIAGLISLGQARRIVQVYHGDPRPSYSAMEESGLKRKVFSHPGITNVAVSEFVSRRLAEVGITSSAKVCYPSAHIEANCQPIIKDKKEDETLRILTVGRLTPFKGLSFLASLARACHEQSLPFQFSLVGGTLNQAFLRQLQQEMACSVSLLGPKIGPELCHAYSSADVCIMPSPQEGFGLVYVEGLRHGKATIALDIPPAQEIFTKDKIIPGLLLNQQVKSHAIREAIAFLRGLQGNPSRLSELSLAALKTGSRFDPIRLAENFISQVMAT